MNPHPLNEDAMEEMAKLPLPDGASYAPPQYIKDLKNKNTGDGELDGFLKTLNIHNKDLDFCFGDAIAVGRLKFLIAQEANKAQQQLLNELMEQKQTCYDCIHDNENLETVDFIPLSVIQNKLEGLS